jgi:hypothetical protein
MQSKVKVFLRNGQSFIAPESNLANIRRMYDREIESIEYSNTTPTAQPKAVTNEAEKRLEQINGNVETPELSKRAQDLIDLGFIQSGDTLIKGTTTVNIADLTNMAPVNYGKLKKTN